MLEVKTTTLHIKPPKKRVLHIVEMLFSFYRRGGMFHDRGTKFWEVSCSQSFLSSKKYFASRQILTNACFFFRAILAKIASMSELGRLFKRILTN